MDDKKDDPVKTDNPEVPLLPDTDGYAGPPPQSPHTSASSFKQDFTLAAAVAALAISAALCIILPGRIAEAPRQQVLIYNADLVAEQARPFIMAGFDGPRVIQQAFDAALAAGHVIIRGSDQIAGPPAAMFSIADYGSVPDQEGDR